MDGTASMSANRQSFRTPIRILLPKLLKSRDDWKAKSHHRKAQLKSATITIRDVSASRARWRQRVEQLEADNRQLQERLARAERERDATRVALTQLEDAQKK